MQAHPISKQGNDRSWVQRPGDCYVVTGIDRNGKRFVRHETIWGMAASVNLWKGSLWLLRDGNRYLIRTVTN